MDDVKNLNVPTPQIGPSLSAESEKEWLAHESAWQWARISDLEAGRKLHEEWSARKLEEHNAWMGHVSMCNRTNLATAISLVVMALVTTGLALAVIAKLV